ncbi:MAG: IclR family transcriptional regulator [Actinomycetales bacterium]
MSNGDAGNGSAVQSVDRALTILALLAERGDLGVTEIAQGLGVHKSTAFRLVATLERHDVVTQTEDRGKYRLGVGVLRLAGATRVRLDLVQESRPVTTELAAQVGETVNVAVLSGHEALYLDQVAGPSALQLHMWAGQRIPLHATSNGKILLAFAPPGTAAALLTDPLPRFTDNTIVSLAELQDQLDLVRSRGYATAVDELERGLTAVAAPIFGIDGHVVASVSASGPTFRLPADRLPAVADAVRAAATGISRRLGWHGVQIQPLPSQVPVGTW